MSPLKLEPLLADGRIIDEMVNETNADDPCWAMPSRAPRQPSMSHPASNTAIQTTSNPPFDLNGYAQKVYAANLALGL
jgi:hypothetical protein